MSAKNSPFSIVIPTAGISVNSDSLIERLLRQLVASGQQNFEIVVVIDINRHSHSTLKRLQSLKLPNLKIVEFRGKFNFSKKCNIGAFASTNDYLLFLNDDVELAENTNFQVLINKASELDAGAVGCVLTYPSGDIQHAGISLRSMKPKNAFAGESISVISNLGPQPFKVSAVTGACLAISRSKFEAINGWDEILSNSYNDVDLCLNLLDRGYSNFVVPSLVLVHHEAQTRDESFDIRAFDKLWQKHAKYLGSENFLYEEPQVSGAPSRSITSELISLGLRGSIWAIYYRITGKSKSLLSPQKR